MGSSGINAEYMGMVYFTCNVCGESLKKKQVDKHCQTSCPSAWYFTCIDCNKTFEGFSYAEHTSCVTETERYAGKYLNAKAEQKKLSTSATNPNSANGKKEEVKKPKTKERTYLVNDTEWMGWKRTIRHILQDNEEKMPVESLWKIVREAYMKSNAYKGQDKTMMRAKFDDKVNRPRFELVESGKFIKLKARK
eukprot:TRINITY_DN8383_c0_g3_i1.p1 TRINITY_DN8383_c0_g3~~TRINITY_DN8383_c0_g3_i1.p1  ORF type:complete len:193 (-),score=48.93 TRINITY_DN8383_c0_g3_i1:20-598(-)